MQVAVEQAFTESTKITMLYDYIPRLYLGLNAAPEKQQGDKAEHSEMEAGERLDNHILALHLEWVITPDIELLVGYYFERGLYRKVSYCLFKA